MLRPAGAGVERAGGGAVRGSAVHHPRAHPPGREPSIRVSSEVNNYGDITIVVTAWIVGALPQSMI
jgi:hypothetical protein